MLTKLYRYGPGRQGLRKGYVVAADDAPAVIGAVCAETSPVAALARARGLLLQADPHQPSAVEIETGLVWLHTAAARQSLRETLQEVVTALAEAVKTAGGRLMPNAVRPAHGPWKAYLCGDTHAIETASEIEKATYCNLVRAHLPELIALTARAGVAPEGVENGGSRRLAESEHHLAARLFPSVSARYLTSIRRSLSRDEGLRRPDLLDVDPNVDGEPGPVRLRFVDGQMMVQTSVSHALTFQALLLRARRMVGQGRSVRGPEQRLLEHNRALAVAHGSGALLAAPPAGPGRAGKGNRDRAEDEEPVPARDLVIELYQELRVELLTLEATYEEMAPLVLGPAMRQTGAPGIQNESDLLRATQGSLGVIDQLVRGGDAGDPITTMNEERSPDVARTVAAMWSAALTYQADEWRSEAHHDRP